MLNRNCDVLKLNLSALEIFLRLCDKFNDIDIDIKYLSFPILNTNVNLEKIRFVDYASTTFPQGI